MATPVPMGVNDAMRGWGCAEVGGSRAGCWLLLLPGSGVIELENAAALMPPASAHLSVPRASASAHLSVPSEGRHAAVTDPASASAVLPFVIDGIAEDDTIGRCFLKSIDMMGPSLLLAAWGRRVARVRSCMCVLVLTERASSSVGLNRRR